MRWRSGLLPDLFGQVAHFVFHLAKDHSFADGNKRTAMSVSLALLDKEGINLAIDDDADPAENTLYKLKKKWSSNHGQQESEMQYLDAISKTTE